MDTINKIKHEIKMKDIKKTDLAKHLGVTPQRLNNWLLRKNIPFEYISKIAEFLGVSTDYLLNNNDTKIIAHNSPIIHNSPNSHISINEAINTLPSEIGAVVKYMLKLNEDERLEFMSKVFSCGKKDK